MTAPELIALIARGSAPPILDVRSRAEYLRGHVPGAVNRPFWAIGRLKLPVLGDDPIVVYCAHGPRAWIAGARLKTSGFTNVVYLDGHMKEWRKRGLPEER